MPGTAKARWRCDGVDVFDEKVGLEGKRELHFEAAAEMLSSSVGGGCGVSFTSVA